MTISFILNWIKSFYTFIFQYLNSLFIIDVVLKRCSLNLYCYLLNLFLLDSYESLENAYHECLVLIVCTYLWCS